MKHRKSRVLHVIPNFGAGGAERLVVDLMEATDKERFEVAAVSLYPESGTILEEEIKEKGLKVYFLNKRRGLDLRMIPSFIAYFVLSAPMSCIPIFTCCATHYCPCFFAASPSESTRSTT